MTCPNCQTELDKHPANRCMDAWVAEFVLGYRREKTPKDANGEFGGDDFLVPPGGIPADFRLPNVGRIGLAYFAPQVSTLWDSTWQLFKRLTMQIACAGSGGQPTGFYVGLAGDYGLFNPNNPCAAFDVNEKLAICKAAIKIQAERNGVIMSVSKEDKIETAIKAPPCPYIKQGMDGKPQCELAEVGLRVLEGKLKKAEQEAGDWKSEWNMFANAWKRELGKHIVSKWHLIDCLVISTRRMREKLEQLEKPIPMLLFCPCCHTQHVDAPEPDKGWTNPPHKSHLCHQCGIVWRPADVPTTGVASISTRGDADTWPSLNKETEQ